MYQGGWIRPFRQACLGVSLALSGCASQSFQYPAGCNVCSEPEHIGDGWVLENISLKHVLPELLRKISVK